MLTCPSITEFSKILRKVTQGKVTEAEKGEGGLLLQKDLDLFFKKSMNLGVRLICVWILALTDQLCDLRQVIYPLFPNLEEKW